MWIRIRAVIIEDEPLAVQYLAALLDDTCQVEVVGSAAESEAEAVNRLLAYLRSFEVGSLPSSGDRGNGIPTADKMRFSSAANKLLPVTDVQ
jgi:DNA-binding NarL/FixJ family response regulator